MALPFKHTAHLQDSVTRTVEMYIMEDQLGTSLDDDGNGDGSQSPGEPPARSLHRRKSITVAPPRGRPLPKGALDTKQGTALQHAQSTQTKKLRVELSMAQSELQSREADTRKADATIRCILDF